jgi:oligoribonuclease NrnB/cAMP/cGMP phosphodiesterase (DHH superfamily)
MNKQVIVHDTDNDGLVGLYLWQGENHDTKWLAHTHGEKYSIEEFKGKDVVFIDCCYDYDYLCEIREVATSIKIFDHHRVDPRILKEFECYHSFEKSATLLIHEYLYPNKEVPEWILQIDKRDLWKKDENTDYWYLGLNALFGMFTLKEVFSILDKGVTVCSILNTGEALYPLYEIVLEDGFITDIEVSDTEHVTFIRSNNPILSSDTAEKFYLKEGCYATVITYNTGDENKPYGYGLRTGRDIDLSVVAKHFGGGGHAKACGFKTEIKLDYKELADYIYAETANNTSGKLII